MGLSLHGGLYAYAVRTLVAGVNDVETLFSIRKVTMADSMCCPIPAMC